MKPLNHHPNHTAKSEDAEWYFIAEISFSDFGFMHEQGGKFAARALTRALLAIGMPLESVENMWAALFGFTHEALSHGPSEFPGSIQVFCPSNMAGELISENSTRLSSAEQTREPADASHAGGVRPKGGWGYYAIERGGDIAGVPGQVHGRVVELYVYQEGK